MGPLSHHSTRHRLQADGLPATGPTTTTSTAVTVGQNCNTQHRVSLCTATMAASAAHLPAARDSACSIFELVMPHKETARATGDERKIVAAFTSGVLKSQIFTAERRVSVAEGLRARHGRQHWHAGLTVKAVGLTSIALVDNVAVGTPVQAPSFRVFWCHPCSRMKTQMHGGCRGGVRTCPGVHDGECSSLRGGLDVRALQLACSDDFELVIVEY
jgi:hypothetical protein